MSQCIKKEKKNEREYVDSVIVLNISKLVLAVPTKIAQ